MLTLFNLEIRIKKSWTRETCHPNYRKSWSIHNPAAGQCAITALLVHEHFGGEIKKCYVCDDSHYFNLIGDKVIDLTKSQFGNIKIDYDNSSSVSPEKILDNPDTKNRYELLLKSPWNPHPTGRGFRKPRN
jgi:hypothetical protein